MGLSSALNTALYGLGYNQRQLDVAAANIASADTVGYTRKSLQASVIYGNNGQVIGTSADKINRSLDENVQRQYRTSAADLEFANTMASYASRVDELLGSIEDPGSLSNVMRDFVSNLSALTTSPDDYTARLQTMQSATALVSELNGTTSSIQQMRQETEVGIGDTVDRINDLVSNISNINNEIVSQKTGATSTVDLEDERDRYIDELSGMVDLTVRPNENGSLRLYTGNGMMLLDVYPSKLQFDERATISAQAQWSEDPTQRQAGTITLVSPGGSTIDMIASKGIGSGKLGALVEMRDNYLVDAQRQLDEIASRMSTAMSNYTVDSTPTAGTTPPAAGFDIDLASVRKGNSATLSYVDTASGETRTVSFVRVDDASQLPLGNDATANPNDTVYGIDFSGGYGSVATQMGAALASAGFSVSNPTSSTVSIVDDGGVTSTVSALSANVTASGLTGENTALPFFTDGASGQLYTDSRDGRDQKIGYAGRIAVNPDLISDVSRLVISQTSPQTLEGDPTRPLHMLDALTQTPSRFDSRAGIGTESAPFKGSIIDYLSEVVGQQSSKAANLKNVQAGQEVVTNNLKDRVDASSKVNMDEELSKLVQLQNAYTANARVMTVVRQLFDVLMQA